MRRIKLRIFESLQPGKASYVETTVNGHLYNNRKFWQNVSDPKRDQGDWREKSAFLLSIGGDHISYLDGEKEAILWLESKKWK